MSQPTTATDEKLSTRVRKRTPEEQKPGEPPVKKTKKEAPALSEEQKKVAKKTFDTYQEAVKKELSENHPFHTDSDRKKLENIIQIPFEDFLRDLTRLHNLLPEIGLRLLNKLRGIDDTPSPADVYTNKKAMHYLEDFKAKSSVQDWSKAPECQLAIKFLEKNLHRYIYEHEDEFSVPGTGGMNLPFGFWDEEEYEEEEYWDPPALVERVRRPRSIFETRS